MLVGIRLLLRKNSLSFNGSLLGLSLSFLFSRSLVFFFLFYFLLAYSLFGLFSICSLSVSCNLSFFVYVLVSMFSSFTSKFYISPSTFFFYGCSYHVRDAFRPSS